MSTHDIHEQHTHVHGSDCGHTRVAHEGHTDYLHAGHLHQPHGDHVDEHTVEAGGVNPVACTPAHDCDAHTTGHAHGPDCGHEAVPHADHTDYLSAGHLHHPHGAHCDDHGPLVTV